MDPNLWEKDKDAARIQRNFVDKVIIETDHEIHPKTAIIIVPIDDTEFGNRGIRKMFGLVDNEKYNHYP